MSKGTQVGYVLAMIVMGAATFAGLGWLVAFREARPVAVASDAVVVERGYEALAPTQQLAFGARVSIEAARSKLAAGPRSPAVHALDAAMRVTDVGRSAASGERKRLFEEAHRTIMAARTAMQEGRPDEAQQHISEVARVLGDATTATGASTPAAAPSPPGKAYAGAVLLNARGMQLGEVEAVHAAEVQLRVGGSRNILGVLDVGGQIHTVPASRLVYGKPRGIGRTLVVLPTLGEGEMGK